MASNISFRSLLFGFLTGFSLLTSCLEEPGIGNFADLRFDRDTVFFDTVFTQLGTATEVLKLYNSGGGRIQIDEIRLLGNSVFRFNANGVPGPIAGSFFIDPGDSLYVFLEATLDPNGGNTPLIFEDSLLISFAGQQKKVVLAVPGQDALYYLPNDTLVFPPSPGNPNGSILPYRILDCSTEWRADRPVVVVGYLVVDSNCSLTIQPGTQVHFFNNGALWIYRGGQLQALGEADQPIVFQGTRLPLAWAEQPGQWDRILINDGGSSNMRHCLIKNAFIGVQGDHLGKLNGSSGPGQLNLHNVEIRNCSGIGLYTRGLNIDASNLLVHNCGQYSAAFTLGGSIRLRHSTLANYWNRSNRTAPTLFFSNYALAGNSSIAAPLNLQVLNSIVYGNKESELEWDSVAAAGFIYLFDHVLLKASDDYPTPLSARFPMVWRNESPNFSNTNSGNYQPASNGAAANRAQPGLVSANPLLLRFDLRGRNRSESLPDLGAEESEN
ncbi:MAG: hypothetical protein ACOYK5_09615 [Bacteroidia bacterium]